MPAAEPAALPGRLVVGVDGSVASERAVAWAVAEARRRRLEMQVVAAWQPPLVAAGTGSAFVVHGVVSSAQRQMAAVSERAARVAAAAGVAATVDVVEETPARVLRRWAVGADQLVVGDGGASGVATRRLRTLSGSLVRRPPVPVTVVRGPVRTTKHRVVVGVDGSPGSRAALRRASIEATAARSVLHVVTAWRLADAELTGSFDGPGLAGAADLAEWARVRAEQMLDEEHIDRGDGSVYLDALHGDHGRLLVAAARHADLLVVGCTGHGVVERLLLGSVSSVCLHRSPCPVQFVPA